MSLIKNLFHHEIARTTSNHVSEEHDTRIEDMARRLADEALRNADDPDITLRFSREVPGSIGDGGAAGWLSHTAEHPAVPKETMTNR